MATAVNVKTAGGLFLIEDQSPHEVFTPEDLTEEHRDIARTAREFFDREVVPHIEEMQHGNFDAAVALLRKAAALGLESVITPERWGGMEMDLTSMMMVAEQFARDGSFAGWHGAHAGIGTLPLLLFGTEAQKQKYLPRISSCELIAAYCLSEPQAGSDALAARTRADLSPDGTHYVLNGQKMWITNGGKADIFTVFAKINGEQFSAFLVERAFPGVSNGAEEKKMGIKGSSTTPIFFDNVQVPVENLLGEAGRGHIIAFNILNIGRLKLGAFAVGGAKNVLQISLAYAKDRRAFGTTISQFGMIRHKLAEMAIRIFAAESMTYRVEGLIKSHLEGFSWGDQSSEPEAARRMMKSVEEFAAECSIIKVYASEMLDYVVDEGVQIHGGYGYHQDYAVERAYRDSRINRIFEGTNEINRLVITGMLLKRAQQGRLGLVKAAKSLMDEVLSGPSAGGDLVSNAKKIVLLLMALAFEKYGAQLEKQQEVMAGIADAIMETFAMESACLRSQKNAVAADICAVLLPEAMGRIEMLARPVLAACSEGDSLRANLAILRRFAKFEPPNSITLRERIAERLLAADRYAV
ncbi:MAG TPA: acyl-CoA dehydrogenase family protein [Bryobacteraceae bacterium]|jgi:alkylation response protein AidB-like acyl-CoA dehydrogenase|nr:acyl-CoA dehydrogenase family protein [Bryobacteraceae bacterium]